MATYSLDGFQANLPSSWDNKSLYEYEYMYENMCINENLSVIEAGIGLMGLPINIASF
jgi:hypothetical protein